MHISPFTIYLWQLADSFRDATFLITLITGICAMIAGIASFATFCEDADENIQQIVRRVAKIVGGAFFVTLMLHTFTPTSKTIAMMVIVPAIADSKVIQQDVPELYNMAVEALKGAIKPAK